MNLILNIFQSREATFNKNVCATATHVPNLTELNTLSECPWNCKRFDIKLKEDFSINETTGQIVSNLNNKVPKCYGLFNEYNIFIQKNKIDGW